MKWEASSSSALHSQVSFFCWFSLFDDDDDDDDDDCNNLRSYLLNAA